jgi:signal transduction histidine kinase/HAMP domain-containing protein
LRLWDSSFDIDLKNDMQIFLDAYNTSGQNPAKMDLPSLVKNMDPLYRNKSDLFLINRSGIIEFTTYKPEYLMDMSVWPDFYPRLLEMMDGDSFVPDEIVKGFTSGSPLRKFVYQSTPDHRYLAQISLNVQNESVQERSALSYGKLVSYVINQSPILTDLHVISTTGNVVIGKKAYHNGKLDPLSRNITNQVFKTHERVVVTDPENETVTTYIFVSNCVDNTPSSPYMNLVGKFVYSTSELNKVLNNNLMIHIFLAAFTSFFAILLAFLVTRRITSPLDNLVKEIDLIAAGALEQEITESHHPEFGRIATSVRSMVRQITGVVRDLQASESRYRGLFHSSTDAIFILDGDEIIDYNPVAFTLFGSGKELKGVTMSSLCQPLWESIQYPLHGYLETHPCPQYPYYPSDVPGISETDIQISFPGGKIRYLNVRVVPLTQNSHPLTQVQIRDITRRVEIEKQLQNLNVDLERQIEERTAVMKATISDLDSFTYTVSHDLRAPLRAIDGNAHLLRVKGNSLFTPDMERHLLRISDNIRLMDHLIDDLLNFSRMSRKILEKEHIDMNALVAEVAEKVLGSVPSSSFEVTLEDLPPASGDITLIRQVLTNLLSNALKFGKSGICNMIRVYANEVEGVTWYHVQDTGIGLDMEYATKIFDVFVRLNPLDKYEGTGVGLAIVMRIVTRHGGHIHVTSEEGVGSTFSFSLEGEE